MNFKVNKYNDRKHRQQVIELWQEVFGYDSPRNAPELVIDKKNAVTDGLFLVAVDEQKVIGTVMAGYDGHRGWIYSLAVLPLYRENGIGTALLTHAEKKLAGLGCVKINLQVIENNKSVQEFYLENGYLTEKRVSMGKLLNENIK
jgi:ribosomal protein S18 acetylase RimI-like enzyme